MGRWERSFVKDGVAVLTRTKTGIRIAIPVELRMDAVGMSLADVIARCKATDVVSKYLIHHVRASVNSPKGSPIKLDTITASFSEARDMAGITGDDAPTFHEIRSLSKRLHMKQGGVDIKTLLGHDRCDRGSLRKLEGS
ncbi:tyrosine-type recombinase/integrase [Paraburkholderia ultramafica]|uniref:tyrosine-type recombinase/integrase n=1 Tax=Paraburkholderia ultramafica TaxID=1544867 RepID=UPI0031B5C86F